MARQPFRREDKIGFKVIYEYFGDCGGNPERWDARRLAIGLFIHETRTRAGQPGMSPDPAYYIGRRADPVVVKRLAAPALELALATVEGYQRSRTSQLDAEIGCLGAADPGSYVYFIQAEHGGPIKIGVAGSVEWRLEEIQRMSPVRLCVVGSQQGGRLLEGALHRRFAAHRLHGEWFAPCEELLSYIEGLDQ